MNFLCVGIINYNNNNNNSNNSDLTENRIEKSLVSMISTTPT